jgi:hypothetical protein
MRINMGSTDRIIRAIVAVVLAVLYFSGVVTGTPGIVFLVIAVLFALTVLTGICPLYMPFGISTCKGKEEEEK